MSEFKSTYLPIRSDSEIIAKSFLIENDDGTLVPVGQGGGGSFDPSKPIIVGNKVINVCSFKNSSSSWYWGTALIKTKVPAASAHKFELDVEGKNIFYASMNEGAPVKFSTAIQCQESGDNLYSSSIVVSPEEDAPERVYYYSTVDGFIAIAIPIKYDTSFDVSISSHELSESEINGWTVEYVDNDPFQVDLPSLTSDLPERALVEVEWDMVKRKPSKFAPEAHTHVWADITDAPVIASLVDRINALEARLGTLEAA